MTRTQRMTQTLRAVSEAPSKTPLIYWPLGIGIIGFGFWRMESHPHATQAVAHILSDWGVVALGVAFLPGAAAKVSALLAAIGPLIPFARRNGQSPPGTGGDSPRSESP